SFMKDYEAEQKRAAEARKKAAAPRPAPTGPASPARRKLTWKEQRELEQLEKDMEELNAEKDRIERLLAGGSASVEEITEASARFGEVKDLLDEKELRWLELSEIANG
ncbi:MAG: ABC transporter ATP-binding protein, partial [Bacteroidales bacterium]|nr:ABC transporter ATP-binding protein [Bacteroidales bacterium]